MKIRLRVKTVVVISLVLLLASYGVAQEESADEVARELANPNNVLTSLKFKTQYRMYKGDLPEADDQDSTTIFFQPTLPFPMASGNTLWIRPGIPLLINQPVFNPDKLDFDSDSGLGDITIDLQYGDTTESGFLWSIGATTTMPTATQDGLGSDRWGLGPGFQVGRVTQQAVLGGFLNHQWDTGGSGEKVINLTTLQIFAIFLPGGAWSFGSSPIMSYDHESEAYTVPVNFVIGKTFILRGRPWKFALDINYFVEQPDAFGQELMLGINISPVVVNRLGNIFK